jgi:hypothetical protein
VIKANCVVMFDDSGGELMAYVFKDEKHEDPFHAIPVPAELAGSIHKWVEQVAPEICLEPHELAPDCMFKAVKKS